MILDTSAASDYEPLLSERVYYRHTQTGDRGYAVRREGRDGIRKDRPMIDEVSFNLGDWKRELDNTDRFSDVQVAQICFEADKKLCWALGHPELAKREWRDMTEKQRVSWLKDGPSKRSPDFERRASLREAILNWAMVQK